jgi:hypothetical protein
VGATVLIGIGAMALIDYAGIPDRAKFDANMLVDDLQGEYNNVP